MIVGLAWTVGLFPIEADVLPLGIRNFNWKLIVIKLAGNLDSFVTTVSRWRIGVRFS